MKRINQDRFNEGVAHALYTILCDLKANNLLLNKENEVLLKALEEKFKEVKK